MPKEMPKAPPADPGKEGTSSWYSLTPNRLLVTLGAPKGEINCDVCVIGGGITGLSAALELSQKGYSVILLDRQPIGTAAAENSGQLARGFHVSPRTLSAKFSPATAKMMCNLTLETLAFIIERIAKHSIKCDLKFGHLTVAANNGQGNTLQKKMQEWEKLGHTDLQYVEKDALGNFIKTKKYISGLLDPKGARLHPTNYALGIAQAAQAAGCRIYDETEILSIDRRSPVRIGTKQGVVNATYVILGHPLGLVPGIEPLQKKVITLPTHMLVTEPLGDKLSHKILPRQSGVSEAGHIMNYFWLSTDNRLLFAGSQQGNALRQKMVDIFPELVSAGIAHRWPLAMERTARQMPDIGRLNDSIFYAHGYGDHGMILGSLAGRLIAEAVSGTAQRFDVFARIKHAPARGGNIFTSLGTVWHRLQDLVF
jgi:gamma-glutamylputrescine oxidase